METKGFNKNEISEKSKEALQSETWQKVRETMKTEVQHFTEVPEIQHFATVKVSKNDNVYGVVWGNVVREYLKTAYSGENAQADVISDGITYKVLKRKEITVFYDVDGNTLFDVENGRLEKEYGYVMQEDKMTAGSEEEIDNAAEAEEKSTDLEKKETDKGAGETQKEKPERGGLTSDIEVTDPVSVKQMAKEKLEKEMKEDEDKDFAEPVIGYLLERCEEDLGLAQDVVQEHKTWKKCLDYIYKLAEKQATKMRAVVRNDVVYEWAEDYYHKDDKAEEEKKAREAAERKKKQEERKKKAAERKKADKKTPKPAVKKDAKSKEKTVESTSPKKKPKEMDGQLDMFSMMGM